MRPTFCVATLLHRLNHPFTLQPTFRIATLLQRRNHRFTLQPTFCVATLLLRLNHPFTLQPFDITNYNHRNGRSQPRHPKVLWSSS